jgi:hypothetical protein
LRNITSDNKRRANVKADNEKEVSVVEFEGLVDVLCCCRHNQQQCLPAGSTIREISSLHQLSHLKKRNDCYVHVAP